MNNRKNTFPVGLSFLSFFLFPRISLLLSFTTNSFHAWTSGYFWQIQTKPLNMSKHHWSQSFGPVCCRLRQSRIQKEQFKKKRPFLTSFFFFFFFFFLSFSWTPQDTKSLKSRIKSPQKSDSWMDAEETRLAEWKAEREEKWIPSPCSPVLSLNPTVLSPPLSRLSPPPPRSLSGLPLLVAGGWGHHLQREPLDHGPWWSAYVAFYDLPLP